MVVTMRKLANLLKKEVGIVPEMVNFKNIGIRTTLGASGFLKYPNGVFIYVNTEILNFGEPRILYRKAKNEKDYVGEWNNYCPMTEYASIFKLAKKLAYM